jgi:hypothetical protein
VETKKEDLAKYPQGSALLFYSLLFSLCSDESGSIKMAGFQNGEACHIIIHAEFFLVQHRILIPVTVYKDLLCGRIGSSLSDYKFPERIRIIRPDSERQGNNHFQIILLYRIAVFVVISPTDFCLIQHPAFQNCPNICVYFTDKALE